MAPVSLINRQLSRLGIPRSSQMKHTLHRLGLTTTKRHEHLQKRLKDFAEVVSIIGVQHAFDTIRSPYRKAMWIILILLGFGLAIYQIQERIRFYICMPTSNDIQIVEPPGGLRFPQITFCNQNFQRKSSGLFYGCIIINI